MAFNKSKHIDAALKYLQQNKLPQAIAEYQHILKSDPKDQVTLMTLGDLFVRQGETFRALEYFERLAQIFLNDGFTTKAIAIYKKVAKLAPEESRPLERLAELYVQQGVLSEARPLYLQLAEVQLKAGRQPQAAALFRKLLEAEPENLRVQTRLGDLYLATGQQKEAIETFHGALQRVFDRGDHAEAVRLADRILLIDAQHQPTLLVKARSLSASGKEDEAAALLESLSEQDPAGETTALLFEQYLETAQNEKAAVLAEKIFARQPKNYAPAHRVANVLLEAGELDRAESLLALVRNAMAEAGEHEALVQTISRLATRRPGNVGPLEWLVDLFAKASDSFRLPDALAQLAQAHEATGDDAKALETYARLLERNPEDAATRRHCARLRAKLGMEPLAEEVSSGIKLAPVEAEQKTQPAASTEPALDEETERFVTQALTDVDLFSSYGLTQKAIDLLDSVLERAPKHTPILERLLDLSVGAGDDQRTADLAARLEQIATERNDRPKIERYAEFRRRFQRAAGTPPGARPAAASPVSSDLQEFAVPTIEAELVESTVETGAGAVVITGAPGEQAKTPMPVESVVHEVDLSDEWAALSQQLEESTKAPAGASSKISADAAEEISTPSSDPGPAKQEAPIEEPAYELELEAQARSDAADADSITADNLLAELAKDIESATSSLKIPSESERTSKPAGAAKHSDNGAAVPAAANGSSSDHSADGPLNDLFEEFRSEMGEMGEEDEDLETHYNLGVAYREMGLLDEAISEFQRVAKASDKAPAFRYAMQCCTLLGLVFMEKGQPGIAAMWYERALLTPELDQESILALRYDLGVSQELAGETAAAFKKFFQGLRDEYRLSRRGRTHRLAGKGALVILQ